MWRHWHLTPYTAIFLAFVFFVTYLLVDYFNIPTVIGIDISRFNIDLLGIVINAVIAIVVFALGYYFVEQWNTKRNKNQRDYAFSLLEMSYCDCLQVLNDLYNPHLLDSSVATSNNHIFCFSLTDCFDKSSPVLNANMVNSEKVEFIINKITICGKDYRPFRPEMISKGMLFMIKLYYEDDPYKNDVFMHITDINHNNRIYKLVCEGGFICDFIEIQKEV